MRPGGVLRTNVDVKDRPTHPNLRAQGLGEYEPREWYLGSEKFRAELLAQVERQAGPRHVGQELTQSAKAKAQRIIREELEALGWGAHELAGRRKGDPEKLRVATRLRRETTMTLAWIAQHLCMGSAGYVNYLLYRKAFHQTNRNETPIQNNK